MTTGTVGRAAPGSHHLTKKLAIFRIAGLVWTDILEQS